MAMEKDYIIHETHSKPITAVGSSFARREIYLGFEDGIVKSIEVDTCKHTHTYEEHKGWVTSFLYVPKTKLLLSASIDSVIVVIGPAGNVLDKVHIGTPIYCMSLNERRKEIIFGTTKGLQFHKIYENKVNNHYIEVKHNFEINEHTNIVRCVLTSDSRIYSAGFDGALVIYDCHYTGDESAIKFFKNKRAHDAGISSLIVEKDNIENNTWLVTGSFDKALKIWTNDGKLIHKFDGFITSITGVCYVPKNKTVWCVAGTNTASIYDPKSGENVTDFIDTFMEQTQEKYYLQLIKYFTDFNVLVTTTSRKQLIVYKYNPFGCLTSIKHKKSLDSICYTQKPPILAFTGDLEDIYKWEQTQSNQLIYSSERLIKTDNVVSVSSNYQGENQKLNVNYSIQDTAYANSNSKENSGKTILKLLFFEKYDLIFAACEDSKVYVWGFDEDAVKILKNMNTEEEKNSNFDSVNHNNLNLSENFDNDENENLKSNENKKTIGDDSVTNRVAGFKLKKIFAEHTSSVTAITIVEHQESKKNYLLSGGWDRKICIWDLEHLTLSGKFENANPKTLEDTHLASDGNILDICFNETNNLFGYASTDTLCYIRKFSPTGSKMVLENYLQGHKSEVNCIRWIPNINNWITGGEDCTIRLWSVHGDWLHLINCGGTVNCICIDPIQGSIIVAAHDSIKVYENEEFRLVQTNVGHADSIRDIIVIPERNCFMSVSWDKTIKIWRAWRKPSSIKKKVEVDKSKAFENWIWQQMKNVANTEENTFV